MISDNKLLPWWEVALLWAGVAISISEIWAGSLIAPAGLFWGLVIILAGHAFGGLFLSATGLIGTRERVLSMECIKIVTGPKGAVIPAVLNVLQLIGWAAIMLALSGETGAMIGSSMGGILASRAFWIILIGAGTLTWSFLIDSKAHKIVHVLIITGIVLLTVLLTIVSLDSAGATSLSLSPSRLHPFEFMRMMDLVIAMPISWVPLIADYSSRARSGKKAFRASFWAYGLVSSWMYIIGLIVTLTTGSSDPASYILVLMGRIGLAIPALLLIFSSTITSNFPDIYSSACSLFSINPKIKKKYTMLATGIITVILAMFFDMSRFEGFLITIGAFFVPLFTILILEYFVFLKKDDKKGNSRLNRRGMFKGFYLPGMISWLCGTLVFFAAGSFEFVLGGSVSSFIAAGLVYSLLRRRLRSHPSHE